MSAPTGKTYRISNFEQLLDVLTQENAERLLGDFALFALQYVHVVNNMRKASPELCEGKSNSELLTAQFEWTDDGLNEITSMEVENTKTGEIQRTVFEK
jgi:hypothetical protein